MSDSRPSLFARVPRGLFGPLGDPYAELYWELLAELYRYEFEREPFVIVRSTAVEAAESIIAASRLWRERREELEALANNVAARSSSTPSTDHRFVGGPHARLSSDFPSASSSNEPTEEATAIRSLARRLVARLEEAGWMHFQYRAGTGEIMSLRDGSPVWTTFDPGSSAAAPCSSRRRFT